MCSLSFIITEKPSETNILHYLRTKPYSKYILLNDYYETYRIYIFKVQQL